MVVLCKYSSRAVHYHHLLHCIHMAPGIQSVKYGMQITGAVPTTVQIMVCFPLLLHGTNNLHFLKNTVQTTSILSLYASQFLKTVIKIYVFIRSLSSFKSIILSGLFLLVTSYRLNVK